MTCIKFGEKHVDNNKAKMYDIYHNNAKKVEAMVTGGLAGKLYVYMV